MGKCTAICLLLIILGGMRLEPTGMGIAKAWAEEAKKEHEAKGGEKEDPNAPHPEYEYLNLKPLVLPIINARGVTQQVSLMVSLELTYGKTEEVKPLEPRLTDAYLRDLYGVLGSDGTLMKGNVIDIVALKKRLKDVTTQVLGEDKVREVLLQVVQQRPL